MQAYACIPEIEPFGSISTKRPEGATGFWGLPPPFWLFPWKNPAACCGVLHSHVRLPYTRDMAADLFFPPGSPLVQLGPIERFMPPIELESVRRLLQEVDNTDDLIVDLFGISPHLAIEAAHAGRSVLVAVNNPVTRFMFHHTAVPFSKSELQAALARFSTAPKDGSRLELFIKDLYRTICSHCGAKVSAGYFIWDRETNIPILKGYECEQCGQIIEEATNEIDRGLAQSYSGKGLQFAMALEQLAPSRDPYRQHAEAALNVYPGRSLYGLVTLLSKLTQIDLSPEGLAPAEAILLYSFDACNALWGYPEGRLRPRRLSLSPQYVESNVWRAMENAVDAWSSIGSRVPIQSFPEEGLPDAGTVAIYPGSARSLTDMLARVVPKWILTVLPRPNQAYWTLSALWASWLWGREAALPIKAALHRRRYDWIWHARALRSVFDKVSTILEDGAKAMAFLPESEPGFVGAALLGLDGAHFRLTGKAFRVTDDQAVLSWEVDRKATMDVHSVDLRAKMTVSAKTVLETRGEPVPYVLVHAAVFSKLAEERQLTPYWKDESGNPLSVLSGTLETVLYDRNIFIRVGRATEIERGLFWLVDPSDANDPLSDRVELAVLQLLQGRDGIKQTEIFEGIYRRFSGFLIPDKRFLMRCLSSYATLDPQNAVWNLREEDRPEVRAKDREEISGLLADIGVRMGFRVSQGGDQAWIDETGQVQYRFQIQNTAELKNALQEEMPLLTYVIPGGRASLVMSKTRRDPRLGEWLKSGPRILKFRHVRRLAEETTLTRENLIQRFTIDPPEHNDPQLPLL
jgi:hypothetical protein